MKYVRLNETEEFTIIEMQKFHPKSRVRERAQMVELSSKEKGIDEITKIVNRTRKTVSIWLHRYEKYGITGLFDSEKSGYVYKRTRNSLKKKRNLKKI